MVRILLARNPKTPKDLLRRWAPSFLVDFLLHLEF